MAISQGGLLLAQAPSVLLGTSLSASPRVASSWVPFVMGSPYPGSSFVGHFQYSSPSQLLAHFYHFNSILSTQNLSFPASLFLRFNYILLGAADRNPLPS
nr:hypothetical protein Iba_chr08dCG7300 [Ipomoea batatas]